MFGADGVHAITTNIAKDYPDAITVMFMVVAV